MSGHEHERLHKLGMDLIYTLQLKVDSKSSMAGDWDLRVETNRGTKTPIGLARCVERLVEESRHSREEEG